MYKRIDKKSSYIVSAFMIAVAVIFVFTIVFTVASQVNKTVGAFEKRVNQRQQQIEQLTDEVLYPNR